jgi:hypothetical protein
MLMMSKSLENFLQAMYGVTFGESPNGTAFAERVSRYFYLIKKSDDGQTAIAYKTELQLFSKKCEVKL